MPVLLPDIPEAKRTPLVRQLLEIIRFQQERIYQLEDQVRLQQERIHQLADEIARLKGLDFIRNKDFATVSVAACGSEHEDCVIHKPLPWPNPRLRLWCSVRHLSQCGSVSRRRGHARH